MATIVTMTKSKATRRSDEVYDAIADTIRKGTYTPGSRLPAETALAEAYGVSRPTVREALARLREDGLVRSRQGSGAYVQDNSLDGEKYVKQISPLTSIDDLKRCLEYRSGLEAQAARLAAVRRSQRDLALLRAHYDAMDQANAAGETGMEGDYAFHLAIARASGNRFIVAGLEQVRPHIAQGMTINRTLSLENPKSRLSIVQQEHLRVIDRIEAGDSDGAGEAMTAHIRNAAVRFLGEAQ